MKRLLHLCTFAMALILLPRQPLQAQGNNADAAQQEQLAVQYLNNREYEKAGALLAELYQRQPNNYYYSYYLQCLIQTQSFKEAEQLVGKQMKRYPKMMRYAVDLGQVYEAEGNAGKAKKQYESCIRQNEHNLQALKELAASFTACGHADYAILCYDQIRKTSGDPYAYAFEAAQVYTRSGLYDKALWEYLQWVKQGKDNTVVLENILTSWLSDDPERQKRDLIEKGLMTFAYKEPDQPCYANLLLWFSMQEGNFSEALKQAVAIDKRYNGQGKAVYQLATVAAENEAYDVALEAYRHILRHYNEFSPYHDDALAGSLHTQYRQIYNTYPPKVSEVRRLDNELDTFFRSHPLRDDRLPLYLTQVQLEANELKNIGKAKKMLQEAIACPQLSVRSKAMCKIRLGDLYHLEDDVWEATLLYSQVEKDFPNDTIGQNAKYRNAKLAFYLHEFEWAKAQLDVLRAATSKLIANDAMNLSLIISDNESEDSLNLPLAYYAKADYLIENREYEKALDYLDSIALLPATHQLEDDILYRKAEIAYKTRQYSKADQLLKQLTTQFPYEISTDDALYLRALINERYLDDPLTAMDLYQQLLKEHPDSLFSAEARQRYRTLRNNNNLKPSFN